MAVIHRIIDVLLEVEETQNARVRLGRYVRRQHRQHLKRDEEQEKKGRTETYGTLVPRCSHIKKNRRRKVVAEDAHRKRGRSDWHFHFLFFLWRAPGFLACVYFRKQIVLSRWVLES